jgi:hypothetical protein
MSKEKTLFAVLIAYVLGVISMYGFFYKIPLLSTGTAIIGLLLGILIGG